MVLAGIALATAALAATSAGFTPLQQAAVEGNMADMERLLVEGADINQKDKHGKTVLMITSANGDYYLVSNLVLKDADITLRDKYGRTALMYAAENGHVYVGRLLIEAGADVHAVDNGGMDAAGYAEESGNDVMLDAMEDAENRREDRLDEMQDEMAALYEEGRYDEAAQVGERILKMRRNYLGDEDPAVASAANDLGYVYEAKGDYDRADKNYDMALRIREKALGTSDPNTADSMNSLGMLRLNTGRTEEAGELLSSALDARKKNLGPNHPKTAQSMKDMAEYLKNKGREKEAEELSRKADAILKNPSYSPGAAGGKAPSYGGLSAPSGFSAKDFWGMLGGGQGLDPAGTGLWIRLAVVISALAALYWAYRARLVQRLMEWRPVSQKQIENSFEAKRLYETAVLAEKAQNFDKAARLYEQTLQLNPGHHDALFHLARVYHYGLKAPLRAKKHYVSLRRMLPEGHAYRIEAVDALARIRGGGK